jgi:hypothetical protein
MSFTISINDQAAFEVQFAGPAGPTGPQGIQGIQGVPGPGVAAGGTTGQVLKKLSSTNYDTGWSSDISGVAWGAITGTLSSQTDLQSALDAKLSTSAASSTYLPKAGGYITGDILSSNGSGLYSSNGASTYTNVSASGIAISGGSGPGSGAMSINWDGITFVSSPYKQTQPFLGLAGYATESWVTAGFYPLTGNPSGFLVAADLAGYATESWVTGQLGSYLPLAGGAMTGSITSAGTTYDTEMAGDFFGVQLSADHTQGTMVNFDGLHTYDGPNSVYVKPTGITFPDATMQTTAYTGTSPTAWGSITGTLSTQTDLQNALDAKLSLAGGAMTGSITSSTVTYDTEMAGDLFGVQLSADHTKGTTVEFDGLDTYDGANHMLVAPTGLTFPDATTQTTAGLTDAPSDGSTYGRNNGSWVIAGGGGGGLPVVQIAASAINPSKLTFQPSPQCLALTYPTHTDVLNGTYATSFTYSNDSSGNPTFTLSGLTSLSAAQVYNNTAMTSAPSFSGCTALSGAYIYNNAAMTSAPDFTGLTSLSAAYVYDNAAMTSAPSFLSLIHI